MSNVTYCDPSQTNLCSKVQGCRAKYDCCDGKAKTQGCEKLCKKCDKSWGTTADNCYEKPHNIVNLEELQEQRSVELISKTKILI